mmetsp:Transcript_27858/g.89852  ORF Transcript_27858/g.89852 Transcript_27858/m.89852 type:complete len:122 (-) Transcript_27858:144-509(-)
MGAETSRASLSEEYDSFSEEDFVDICDDPSQSQSELAEKEILAEFLRSLIDITAGPPAWTTLLEKKKPTAVELVVSTDESLVAHLLAPPDLPDSTKERAASLSSSELRPPSAGDPTNNASS